MKASRPLSTGIGKLMKNNRFVAVLSLILAIVLWLVISIAENPQRSISVGDVPITIHTQGTLVSTLGLDVVSKDQPVKASVTVSGPSYIVSSLMPSDISVTADLSKVTAAGTYELKLDASRNSLKSGYTILSVSPSTVTITFDVVETKSYHLDLVAIGASAADGLVAEEPVLSEAAKDTIEITGPRTEMSRIASVAAVAEVNDTLEKTTTFPADILLYDTDGKVLNADAFTLSFDTVNIAVPIFRERLLPVSLNDLSSAAITKMPVSFSSPTVTVRGEPSDVDEMSKAQLALIDVNNKEFLNGLGKTVTVPIGFDLPASVRLSMEGFTATFDLKGYTKRTVRVTNIKAKDLSGGNTAKFNTAYVDVTLCGPAAVLNALSPAGLTLTVNCSGKTAGTYNLSGTVDLSGFPSVWTVGDNAVSVTIQ